MILAYVIGALTWLCFMGAFVCLVMLFVEAVKR